MLDAQGIKQNYCRQCVIIGSVVCMGILNAKAMLY
jgi:hypothetical protein